MDDPLYNNSRIVYSVYNDDFTKPLRKEFKDKLMIDGIQKEDLNLLAQPTFENLTKLALSMSDAVVIGSPEINKSVLKYIESINKPVLEYKSSEEYIDAYSDFYDDILKNAVDED